MKNDLTAEQLRNVLSYDHETGTFTWKIRAAHRIQIGDEAGCLVAGYVNIKVLRYLYSAHRLAWLHFYGAWPSKNIDHINGMGSDNRIANLREATQAQNLQNTGMRSNNTSGRQGVHWFKPAQMWMAAITVNRKKINLGYFKCLDEAGDAYLNAKRRLHTFSPEVRLPC